VVCIVLYFFSEHRTQQFASEGVKEVVGYKGQTVETAFWEMVGGSVNGPESK